jgi:O-antigen/teichoic acid export membrane protein
MSDLHSSIRKSSLWMIARLGISLTVGAYITTYIIRSLSIKDYGVYVVLYSLIGYVGIVGDFGIPSVFHRFIPEMLQKEQYTLLKKLIFRGLILRLLLSAVTVSIMMLLHEPIGRLLKLENFLSYFSVFAFGIILLLEASLLTSVLHSLFLHKYSVIASTIYTVFRSASIYIFLREGWGIRGILWAEIAAWLLWIVIQLFFYNIKFCHRYKEDCVETAFPQARFFRYAGFSSLNLFGDAILGVSTDFFVITAFLGPSAVAHYAFASRVISIFQQCMPHRVLIDVIRPSFIMKYTEGGNKHHLVDMFNLLLKIGAFCVFPLSAGLFVLSDQIIVIIFRADYLQAKPILLVLAFCMAINIIATPTALVLEALEKVEIFLYNKLFAIYNLAAELFIIQCYGVMGVVLVTCSANMMRFFFSYFFARKYCNIRIDWRGLGMIAINAGIMSAAIWPLRSLTSGLVSLALVVLFGGVVFLICSWLNKGFTNKERDLINRMAPCPVFVF